MIIVGDPGLGIHNVGRNFNRVAQTLKTNIESSECGCDTADIVRASNVSDIVNALTTGKAIDGNVYFIGHSSPYALFVGEQSGVNTNLDPFTAGRLPRNHKLDPDAEVTLLSCKAGYQGPDQVSIAQIIANRLNRSVNAYPTDLLFSPNPNAAGNGANPGSQPPASGPLYMVPVIDGTAPIKYDPQ